MQIDLFHHIVFEDNSLLKTLTAIQKGIADLQQDVKVVLTQGAKIMATLDALTAAVAKNDSAVDSAVTLIKGLAAQVAALAPNQAAIDALAADIGGRADALAAAVVAGTDAAPAP